MTRILQAIIPGQDSEAVLVMLKIIRLRQRDIDIVCGIASNRYLRSGLQVAPVLESRARPGPGSRGELTSGSWLTAGGSSSATRAPGSRARELRELSDRFEKIARSTTPSNAYSDDAALAHAFAGEFV
ncbi:hypothetical protein EVAR_18903_1 [Eumeta japonica]|uniref:Uncharacterized protein n=1 Tax=Eumeta variegata TaxID=151549 RepID=A0A4C1V1T4_EUMVA|nr:hypothetical protein EVAR_18903_1 [Eumeta japonica]